MTIAILKKSPGQKQARPFNRASSFAEAVEMLTAFSLLGNKYSFAERKRACASAAEDPEIYAAALGLKWKNKDTDKPVVALGDCEFYAFTEE